MSIHKLIAVVDNILTIDPVRGDSSTMDMLYMADGVGAGTQVMDITAKDNPALGVGITVVSIYCSDDATRDLYEALDPTRLVILSAIDLGPEMTYA